MLHHREPGGSIKVEYGAEISTVANGQAAWLERDDVACPPVTDCDMDGVRAMYRASIQRAMHDACGATVVAPTQVQQMKFAKQAWNFLYSDKPEFRDERWFVCMLANVDPEALEARMAVAAIPSPTYETLRNAWTQLELAYWRLHGKVGPMPEPRPENTKPASSDYRSTGKAARVAKGHRVAKNAPAEPRDRRDAGKPLVPKRGCTLLFSERRRPGVPVRPKFSGGTVDIMGSSGRGAQLKLFGF
jgi:hypothetical protein